MKTIEEIKEFKYKIEGTKAIGFRELKILLWMEILESLKWKEWET